MMSYIRINDPHSIRAISEWAHIRPIAGSSHCIAAYNQSDKLMGGVLYTDWNNMGSVQMHMALFGGFGGMRPLLWLVYQYPFVQLDVKKVFGLVPEFNHKARNMNLHMGFKVEYLVHDVFGGPEPNGMYLMSMMRDECRWLKMKCPQTINYAPEHLTNRMARAQALYDMPAHGSA